MGYSYLAYSVNDFMANKLPAYRVTTPIASFNHVACTHSPTYADLPVRAMQRFISSGVTSVVLRGCISFNPMYREYSQYSPKLFPHAVINPYQEYRWQKETVFSQYQTYLNWVVSFVNEFKVIDYVELFNEYLFKGSDHIPFNKLLLAFIMREWHKLKPFIRPDVLWGVSEPLIGAIDPEKHAHQVHAWRQQLGLNYTGLQLHQNKDVLDLPFPFAVTENYTTRVNQSPNVIYHGY